MSDSTFRLIYSSHSCIPQEDNRTALGAIFTTARRKNRDLGITGALVITDDAFAQALEGDEAEVRALYERICEDPRHDRVTLLHTESDAERVFGRWAMAKVAADGGPDIRLLSNAGRQTIVMAGGDEHVTSGQESVLAFMRKSISDETLAR